MSTMSTLPADPTSVSAARRFVADQTDDLPMWAQEALSVCVSELATNSVKHAGTPFTLRVVRTPSEVRVEVTDHDAALPRVRNPSTTDLRGRGLQIVEALSDDWGTEQADPPPGKTVWFVVRIGRDATERP